MADDPKRGNMPVGRTMLIAAIFAAADVSGTPRPELRRLLLMTARQLMAEWREREVSFIGHISDLADASGERDLFAKMFR